MDKEFEYIDIVFENCDSVRIPSELVLSLFLDDITSCVMINYVGQFIETWNCKDFHIELKNDALDIKTHHGDDSLKDYLEFKNITHIFVKTEKEFYIGVPWESADEYDYKNLLQENKFNEDSFEIGSKYVLP